VARAVAGIQAQDRYAARLAFRSRSRRLTAADVDRAGVEERALLRTWVMRMTIHLIPSDDAGWMLPLFEPGIERWSRRRLEQLGMPPEVQEKGLRVIERTLRADGESTRGEMARRLERAGIRLDQWTRLHIIHLAVVSGIACLGPDPRGSSVVLREEWLGKLPRFDREAALAELARRYVRAFGPATERDFAAWSGLGLREVRTGLAGIAGELREVRVGEEVALVLDSGAVRLPPAGQVRLLGAFDTYLLGYASRDFAVPPGRHGAIKRGGGGWIRPAITSDGAVIGTWRASRKGGKIDLSLEPFAPVPPPVREAVEAEVYDIARFEGVTATLDGGSPGILPTSNRPPRRSEGA
jgi:hypothetical protein